MRTAEQHAAIVAGLLEPLAGRDAVPVDVSLPALGAPRVLARDVHSPIDLPPFANSQMDGFAVDGRDLAAGAELRVAERITAGSAPRTHERGTASPIMTGAPVPAGADVVIAIEQAVPDAFPADGADAVVRLPGTAPAGQYVRGRGSDVRRGDLLLAAGTALRAAQRGALAAAGIVTAEVLAPVRVLVLSTGDELVPAGGDLEGGAVHDANSVSLGAALREAGATVVASEAVADEAAALLEALERLGGDADLVVTTGGVSQGVREVVRDTLGPLGVEFTSIGMQPGGPQGAGVIDLHGRRVPVVAFPGNPVSTLVSFELLLRPPLRRLLGLPSERPRGRAALAAPVTSPAGKLQVRRGRLDPDGRIVLVGGPSSHLLHSYAMSTHLVLVPAGVAELPEGAELEIWRIDE